MIIIQPSFYEFIKSKNRSLYWEMARPDTKFKGSNEEYSVSSRTPIFTDEYDIYYLYQFPPSFWAAAMAARYNYFLYKAKVEGEKYNDVQDVALKGQGGTTIVFKNRNTFAKHLVDKIQRDVDVDFFRKHGKELKDIEKHMKEAEGHRAAGKDLGGYIGASLENPQPHKRRIRSYTSKKTGESKDVYEDVWTAKGFTSPSQNSIASRLEAWQKASSDGWLQPLEDTHVPLKYRTRGGTGRPGKGVEKKTTGRDASTREYRSFTGDNLKEIWAHMKHAGALPFNIDQEDPEALASGLVSWPEVTIRQDKTGKTRNYAYFTGDKGINGPKDPKNPLVGEPVPVLFDGAAVHSHDIDAYESAANNLKKLENLGPEDLNQIKSNNLDEEIRRLREEISRKDIMDLWDIDPDTDISKERSEAVERLGYLENMLKIREWTKSKYPNQPINSRIVQEALPKLKESLQADMQRIKSNARKYKEHQWNTHEYNREREPHDPLGVGMDNPTTLGPQKYESLSDRTRGFGVLWPNRSSKHMMHGPEGEWEEKFQPLFGAGKNPTHLSEEDKKELQDQVNIYLNRIGQKLASDKETLEYLGLNASTHRPSLVQQLANPESIRRLIQSTHSDVEFNSKYDIVSGDVPHLLAQAYQELLDTWRNAAEINREVETGFSAKSAINEGVRKLLRLIADEPHVLTAMESMQELIAKNAENYIRRTIGHSAWKNYEENLKKGGISKHKAALDLKSFIEAKAYSYAGIIAQLKLGDNIETRRIRYNRDAGRIFAMGRDSEDQAYDFSDAQAKARLQARSEPEAPIKKAWNATGRGEHKPGATRAIHSDSLKGQVGSNVDVMYKYLVNNPQTQSVINKDAQQGIKDLEERKDKNHMGSVDSQEADMIKGMSASTAYFFMIKNDYIDEMKEKGMPVNDNEANKVAHQRVIAYFKQNKWISSDYGDQAHAHADQPGIAASTGGSVLPNIDRKVPEAEAERVKRAALQAGAKPEQLPQVQAPEPTPQLAPEQQPQKVVPVSKGLAGRIKRPPQTPIQ